MGPDTPGLLSALAWGVASGLGPRTCGARPPVVSDPDPPDLTRRDTDPTWQEGSDLAEGLTLQPGSPPPLSPRPRLSNSRPRKGVSA